MCCGLWKEDKRGSSGSVRKDVRRVFCLKLTVERFKQCLKSVWRMETFGRTFAVGRSSWSLCGNRVWIIPNDSACCAEPTVPRCGLKTLTLERRSATLASPRKDPTPWSRSAPASRTTQFVKKSSRSQPFDFSCAVSRLPVRPPKAYLLESPNYFVAKPTDPLRRR